MAVRRFLAPGIASWIVLGSAGYHAQTPVAPIHVLKISSGASGTEVNGTFTLSAERSIFNRTDDREVIVIFQWQGRPGNHTMVGTWRSPDGRTTSNSTFDVAAKTERFGGIWSLALTPSMELGTWSIEATVDGVPAGRHTFELTDRAVSAAVVRPPLTQQQLYERLNAVIVYIRRVGVGRAEMPPVAGFTPGGANAYTVADALDETREAALLMRDGTERPIETIAGLNRGERWMALTVADQQAPMVHVKSESIKVGDRCFSIEGVPPGPRAMTECRITGLTGDGTNTTYAVSFVVGSGAPGAPVVDQFGELIGMALDPSSPGVRRIAMNAIVGPQLMSVYRLPSATMAPARVADMRANGAIIPPVVGSHVSTGGLALTDAKGKVLAQEHHDTIAVSQPGMAVFITWQPKERLRGQLQVKLFDAENRLVYENKPTRADFRPGRMTVSTSLLPVPKRPGNYRTDVYLDTTAVWRAHFRVVP